MLMVMLMLMMMLIILSGWLTLQLQQVTGSPAGAKTNRDRTSGMVLDFIIVHAADAKRPEPQHVAAAAVWNEVSRSTAPVAGDTCVLER